MVKKKKKWNGEEEKEVEWWRRKRSGTYNQWKSKRIWRVEDEVVQHLIVDHVSIIDVHAHFEGVHYVYI